MISIFVPAYNVEKNLSDTIRRIPASTWPQIKALHIINDGSTDHTGSIAEEIAVAIPCVHVHHLHHNEGYGSVVRRALAWCLEDACDTIVCLHGDGQYAPEMLPSMLETMDGYGLDVLQGSRLAEAGALRGGMPLYKWVAGHFLCWLENVAFGLRLTDFHSGYLLYRRRFVELSDFHSLVGNFEIDLELIATARARKFKIGEVAIPTRYAGEVSHLSPVSYGFRVLNVLYRYRRGVYDAPCKR